MHKSSSCIALHQGTTFETLSFTNFLNSAEKPYCAPESFVLSLMHMEIYLPLLEVRTIFKGRRTLRESAASLWDTFDFNLNLFQNNKVKFWPFVFGVFGFPLCVLGVLEGQISFLVFFIISDMQTLVGDGFGYVFYFPYGLSSCFKADLVRLERTCLSIRTLWLAAGTQFPHSSCLE